MCAILVQVTRRREGVIIHDRGNPNQLTTYRQKGSDFTAKNILYETHRRTDRQTDRHSPLSQPQFVDVDKLIIGQVRGRCGVYVVACLRRLPPQSEATPGRETLKIGFPLTRGFSCLTIN